MNGITALSCIIMGFGNLRRKQWLKGLCYLATEVLFILFMMQFGIGHLIGLLTLGTKVQGWVFDEALGIEVMTAGDNSMLMLIYGVTTLVLIALFLVVYSSSVLSSYRLEKRIKQGKKVPTLKEELASLLDEKFHITLLSVPIIGIVIFTVLPLIFMVMIAFTNFDGMHQPPGNLFTWVGMSNFKDMLGGSTKFGHTFFPVLGWTLIWAVVATFSNYILGILLAMLINKKGIRFKKLWRTIFVLTMAIPQFISLLIMRNMLHDYGPINAVLQNMGLVDSAIPFLSSPLGARISVLLVNLWIGIPYTMLITSGILLNIPSDLYDAARIDGASNFKTFKKITMPYIFFVTAPYLITQFIGNINNFNVIYLLTAGEPKTTDYYFAGKTDLLITWLYKLTVNQNDYNRASTIGIVVFIISIIFSLIAFSLTSSQKQEDDFK